VGAEKHILLDLGSWNYTHHKLMLGVYSHVVLFVVAYIASLAYYKKAAPDDLTVYGYLKMRRAMKNK
jgi:SSS family solute:Na+ symporter